MGVVEFVILFAVFYAILGPGRRSCMRSCRRMMGLAEGEADRGRGALRERSPRARHVSGMHGRAGAASLPRSEPETELEVLQRRFVEGRLTMEEYEHALDELDSLD